MVPADGSAVSQTVTLTYDGKDCAVTGRTTRTLTAKGRVLTLATAFETAKGGKSHDLSVFNRQ